MSAGAMSRQGRTQVLQYWRVQHMQKFSSWQS